MDGCIRAPVLLLEEDWPFGLESWVHFLGVSSSTLVLLGLVACTLLWAAALRMVFVRNFDWSFSFLRLLLIGYAGSTGLFALSLGIWQTNKLLLVLAAIHNLFEWGLIWHLSVPEKRVQPFWCGSCLWILFILTLVVVLPGLRLSLLVEQPTGLWCDCLVWCLMLRRWVQSRNSPNRKLFRIGWLASTFHFGQIFTLIAAGLGVGGQNGAITLMAIILFSAPLTFFLYAEFVIEWDTTVKTIKDEEASAASGSVTVQSEDAPLIHGAEAAQSGNVQVNHHTTNQNTAVTQTADIENSPAPTEARGMGLHPQAPAVPQQSSSAVDNMSEPPTQGQKEADKKSTAASVQPKSPFVQGNRVRDRVLLFIFVGCLVAAVFIIAFPLHFAPHCEISEEGPSHRLLQSTPNTRAFADILPEGAAAQLCGNSTSVTGVYFVRASYPSAQPALADVLREIQTSTRKEPGNEMYEVFELKSTSAGPESSWDFAVIERYRDEESLQKHLSRVGPRFRQDYVQGLIAEQQLQGPWVSSDWCIPSRPPNELNVFYAFIVQNDPATIWSTIGNWSDATMVPGVVGVEVDPLNSTYRTLTFESGFQLIVRATEINDETMTLGYEFFNSRGLLHYDAKIVLNPVCIEMGHCDLLKSGGHCPTEPQCDTRIVYTAMMKMNGTIEEALERKAANERDFLEWRIPYLQETFNRIV